MSKEKQIEKMADKVTYSSERQRRGEYVRRIVEAINYRGENDHEDLWSILYDFEKEITAGYRKQSEWISVEERLPVPYADVIVYDKASGVIMDSMLSTGEFVNGIVVTHWMPLPEAPKGGAE